MDIYNRIIGIIVHIGSTKSTVVTVAGAAGVVCGPGAPACGGALGIDHDNQQKLDIL